LDLSFTDGLTSTFKPIKSFAFNFVRFWTHLKNLSVYFLETIPSVKLLNLFIYSLREKGLLPAGCASATLIYSEIIDPSFIVITTFPPKHLFLGLGS
jgi:hypothetical protein